jgi:hypothetical protein
MSALSLPQARIPIGWAMVAGNRVAVEIDTEWMRAFTVIKDRVGGVSGPSVTDVDGMLFAPMQPATLDAAHADLMQPGASVGDMAGELMQPDMNQTIEVWSL